ncbi:MAG: hypothetical protein KDK30_16600 [Leptospiraceae bacterium]|nr:hypothetical protein [Leptospiraceae bacterium]
MEDAPDQNQQTSLLARIAGSITGMLLGAVLIPVGLVVFILGAQLEDDCGAPCSAVSVQSTPADGSIVYATGRIQAAYIGDRSILKPGPYFRWERMAQAYSYAVNSQTGDCIMLWTADPNLNIHNTEACAGQFNGEPYTGTDNGQVDTMELMTGSDRFGLDANYELVNIPGYTVTLADIRGNQVLQKQGDYFYFNEYCINDPGPDCERFRYTVYRYNPESDYTVLGVLHGNRITANEDQGHPLIIAPADYADLIRSEQDQLHSEKWVYIIIGFMALFFGCLLLVNPIRKLLGLIPVLGTIGRGVLYLGLFLLSILITFIMSLFIF